MKLHQDTDIESISLQWPLVADLGPLRKMVGRLEAERYRKDLRMSRRNLSILLTAGTILDQCPYFLTYDLTRALKGQYKSLDVRYGITMLVNLGFMCPSTYVTGGRGKPLTLTASGGAIYSQFVEIERKHRLNAVFYLSLAINGRCREVEQSMLSIERKRKA